MIVRNEEALVLQAIDSVAAIVSEIIVVDTGSEDKTIELVQSRGAQVFSLPWQNDFSASRNYSLEKASGDWILVLDADEAIASEDHQELLSLLNATGVCYEFLQRHYSNDARLSGFKPAQGEYPLWERNIGGYFESNCVRLFPRHEQLRFRGRVHELVEHSIRELGLHRIERTRIPLHHYGHTEEVKQRKSKGKLYSALGEAKLRESPRDWKNYFEIAVEYHQNNRLEEAVQQFSLSLALRDDYLPSWTNLGYVLWRLGRYGDARIALSRALQLDPRSDEAYGNLGLVFLTERNFAEAERCLRQALRFNPQYITAWCNLGRTMALAGRLAEGALFYRRALELFPDHASAQADLGALYLAAGLREEARSLLESALRLDPTLVEAQANLKAINTPRS